MAEFEIVDAVIDMLLKLRGATDMPVYVAVSGGIDSTVLLHIVASKRDDVGDVRAIHVNHSIQSVNDLAESFVRDFCISLNVPLHVEKVKVIKHSGDGLEASARHARYHAFTAVAPAIVLTAHHLDDSAETVLLNLCRGSGLHGVSGIADVYVVEGLRVLRPLLVADSVAIRDYAARHDIRWVGDPSNYDLSYRRNWVRNCLFPMLRTQWPNVKESINRFAANVRCAQGLLDQQAAADELDVVGDYSCCMREKLRSLGINRVIELIKRRLYICGVPAPSKARFDEWVHQIFYANVEEASIWNYEGLQCVLTADAFWLLPKHAACEPDHISWCGEGVVAWPSLDGILTVERVKGQGISLAKLADHEVCITVKEPGMKVQLAANRPHQLLKILLQNAKVPNWMRPVWPVIVVDGNVAFVPEVGCCIDYLAARDEDGLLFTLKPFLSAKCFIDVG